MLSCVTQNQDLDAQTHARKSLEHAKKVYEEDKTSENLNNYQQALNDYYSTPAGLGELRKKYEDTGDRAFLFYHAERQAFREKQLVEYNNEVERRRIAKEVFSRAMDSDLDYQGPKPLWWNEYVERAKNHEDERLNTTPELLDVIETGHGKVAVVWEPSSQDDNDRFPQLEKGMHVGITRFRRLYSRTQNLTHSNLVDGVMEQRGAPLSHYAHQQR